MNSRLFYRQVRRFLVIASLFGLMLSCAAAESKPEAKVQKNDTWHGYAVLPAGTQPVVPIHMSDAEWQRRLTPFQFKVLRQEATEAACSGATWNEHRKGTYYSAATGQPLFSSETKFESGTGWPSFYQPIKADAVILRWDNSFGMHRIEVLDSSSASHLGHIFDDASDTPSGLRFCMNSESMIFVPAGDALPDLVRQYQQLSAAK